MQDIQTSIEYSRSYDLPTIVDGMIREGNERFSVIIGMTIHGNKGEYQITEFLKAGGQALVYKCNHEGQLFVLKIYDNRQMTMQSEKRKRFVEFLYDKAYDNIVTLYDYGTISHAGWLMDMQFDVYPFMKNGTLLEKKKDVNYLITTVIPQVNEALRIIHLNRISHKDIKPGNILISNDGERVMIHDFSIMSVVEADGGRETILESKTYGFAGPEVLSSMPHMKSDYYAFGITLLQLLLGKEVYEGMDDEAIRRCTYYGNIPHLNPHKFDKLFGVKLSAKERIEGLICGLTKTDINERWGYEEVSKWCRGEIDYPTYRTVEISEMDFQEPFLWKGQQCHTLNEIAIVLANDWNEAIKDAKNGVIADWLKLKKPDIASKLYTIINETAWSIDEQANNGYFRMIYTISPNVECIYWLGNSYSSFSDLAADLLKRKVNRNKFQNLLKAQYLSWMLENNSMMHCSLRAIDSLKEIEMHASASEEEALNMFIMQFMPLEWKRTLSCCGDNFEDLQNYYMYAVKFIKHDATWLKEKFFDSPWNCAWMWYEGNLEFFLQARNRIVGRENDNKTFLVMVDAIYTKRNMDTQWVRREAMKDGKYAHILWLKDNLSKYEYKSKNAIEIRRQIESIPIKDTLCVEEIFKNFSKLELKYNEFVKNTCSNLFLLSVVGDKGKVDIVPRTLGAAFLSQSGDVIFPAELVKGTYNLLQSEELKRCREAAEEAIVIIRDEILNPIHLLEDDIKSNEKKRIGNTNLRLMSIIVTSALLFMMGIGIMQLIGIWGILFALFANTFLIISIVYELRRRTLISNNARRYEGLMERKRRVYIWERETRNRLDKIMDYYIGKKVDEYFLEKSKQVDDISQIANEIEVIRSLQLESECNILLKTRRAGIVFSSIIIWIMVTVSIICYKMQMSVSIEDICIYPGTVWFLSGGSAIAASVLGCLEKPRLAYFIGMIGFSMIILVVLILHFH